MVKRALAWALALCLSLSLTVVAWAAQPTITVTPSRTAPAVGETFTVDVAITGNPGIGAVQFRLTFDPAVLDCVAVETGAVLKGALAASNPDAEGGAIVAAASASALTADGTIATFTFKVVGQGAVSFGFRDYVLSTTTGAEVPFTLAGASLTEPEQPPKPTEPTTPPKPTSPPKPVEPQQPAGETVEHTFSDTVGHWAAAYISDAVEKGFFQGYADGTFRPGKNVTRGEFVTVMWRMAGQPAAASVAPFADTQGIWCEDAISWAYEQGLVNGKTAQRFAPGDSVTRQEAMKILFLYNGGKSGQEVLFTRIYDDTYTDSDTLASWAKAPMYWAVYNEIISGTSDTTLGPRGAATRAQLAKILVNYAETLGA